MKRLIGILRSPRLRELFVYGVVGVLTTAINYAVYAGGTRGLAALLGIAPDHGVRGAMVSEYRKYSFQSGH